MRVTATDNPPLKKAPRLDPSVKARLLKLLTRVVLPIACLAAFFFSVPKSAGTATVKYAIPNPPAVLSLSEIAELRRADLETLGLASTGSGSGSGSAATPSVGTKEAAALKELAQCESLQCISALHSRLGPTKFNLPHFFILGWQKCATTSLYNNLARHPQVAKPFVKEPHYFTACQRGGPACKVAGGNNSRSYIRDSFQVERAAASGLSLATMDASVDYAQSGDTLAPLFKELFPWLKLIFVMRERIGRAMSWKNMLAEKFDSGCKNELSKCLGGSLRKLNYSGPMAAWLAHFPPEQILVMQMESLAEAPEVELKRMKVFLGLDPAQPAADLRNVNRRPGSSGWPMSRYAYEGLVEESKSDGKELAKMLEKAKLANADEWLGRWDAVYQRNYDTCDDDGNCKISSS